MSHEWSWMDVSGFADGDTDFAALLDASPQPVKDRFDELVMSPLVNGMVDGVLMVICGHSDRIDSGAEDHRARLLREGAASLARANSADDAVLWLLGRDWLDPPPTSWAQLPQIAVYKEGHGASALISDGGDEAARRQNRRVTFRVCRFSPDE